MATAMEDVIRYGEYLLLGGFPHFTTLMERIPGKKLDVITSFESCFKLQCTEAQIRSAAIEAEKIRKNESSPYGFHQENVGAVCIGWKNPGYGVLTSAILVWALKNTLPKVQVVRTMLFEDYSKALQETMLWPQEKVTPSQFRIIPESDGVLSIMFDGNNQSDFFEWKFIGAEGTLLKEYLQKEVNLENIKSDPSDLSTKLILSFET